MRNVTVDAQMMAEACRLVAVAVGHGDVEALAEGEIAYVRCCNCQRYAILVRVTGEKAGTYWRSDAAGIFAAGGCPPF